jgi:hypothetical protein
MGGPGQKPAQVASKSLIHWYYSRITNALLYQLSYSGFLSNQAVTCDAPSNGVPHCASLEVF